MAEKSGVVVEIRNPVVGRVSGDLVAAKENLRDRLFPSVEKGMPQAFALRKAKCFQPAPDVNLVGLGVGEKVTEGKRTGEMCVQVFVAKKFPKGKVSSSHRISATIEGIPTDIEGVGYPRKFQIPQQQKQRPILGGVSVGLDLNAVDFRFAGTLGLVVADRQDPIACTL